LPALPCPQSRARGTPGGGAVLRPVPPSAVRGPAGRARRGQLRDPCQPRRAAPAGRLLGAVVRPVPRDGAAVRAGRGGTGTAGQARQGGHPVGTGAGPAFRDPQHPDAGAVPPRPRTGAPGRRDGRDRHRALGTRRDGRRPMTAARITVVGSGFAGVTALRTLRAQDRDAELTLVAPAAELHYLPGAIWLPSGKRTRDDLVVPLGGFLRRERIAFHAAHATGLSVDGRVLHTDAGDVANDGLVIATGARFLRKLPGIEHAIVPCEGVAAG